MASKKNKSEPNLEDIVGGIEDIEISYDYPVFSSGVVCDLLEVSPWFLKQLDDEGLVSPPRQNENSTRFYSKNELNMVAFINKLMNTNKLNIDGVKLVLKLHHEA